MKKFLIFLISVILSSLICISACCAVVIYTVRDSYADCSVSDYGDINFSKIELFVNGKNVRLFDLVNNNMSELGIEFDEESFDSFFKWFHMDSIIYSFVDDLRVWLFFDGAVPVINNHKNAEIALSDYDTRVWKQYFMVDNPIGAVEEIFNHIIPDELVSEITSKLTPLKHFFDIGTFIFILSIIGVLFILLYFINGSEFLKAFFWTGIGTGTSCLLLFLGMRFIRNNLGIVAASTGFSKHLITFFVNDYEPYLNTFIAVIALIVTCTAIIPAIAYFLSGKAKIRNKNEYDEYDVEYDDDDDE